ncbi:hypothetical protein U6M36_10735, partial [Cutibacterium acnes]
ARGDDLPDWPVLLRMADEALYQAKREGRNRAFVRCLKSDRSSLGKVCKTFLPDCRDGTIAT